MIKKNQQQTPTLGFSWLSLSTAASEVMNTAGWQWTVFISSASGPSMHRDSRSYPRIFRATVNISLTLGYFRSPRPMPTNWLPWPGKSRTEQSPGSFFGLLCFSMSGPRSGVSDEGEPGMSPESLLLRGTRDLTFPLEAAVNPANMADNIATPPNVSNA